MAAMVDTFYFTPEELELESPSRMDGYTVDQEASLRVLGADLVQKGGILLHCPQVAMAMGQILLHN